MNQKLRLNFSNRINFSEPGLSIQAIHNQRCNRVESSGHMGHFLSGSKWASPRHAYMPDPDQNYLLIMYIKNCNE